MYLITFIMYNSRMPDYCPTFPDPGIHILTCQRTRLATWTHANLRAPYWRFYWNPRPGGAVRLTGNWVELAPNLCMAIPPHTPFASRADGETEQFYLHFLAARPHDRVPPGLFPFPLTPDLREACEEASRLLPAPEQPGPPRLGVLLMTLACAALRQVPADQLGILETDPRVTAAIERIEEDPGHAIPNDTLADEAHMNTNAFIRLFKAKTGETPQAYAQRKRIERACVLLHTTDATLEEIAEDLGFCDRYHFSKAFKRLLGQGPARFRRVRG